MSLQRMNAKSTRRVIRAVDDLTITRAWVNNGEDHDVVLFATWQHEHGWWDRSTGVFGYNKGGHVEHFSSCYDAEHQLLMELEPFGV